MDIDFAKLSPGMSAARLANSHQAAILKLAKETIEMSGEMLTELLDAVPASVPGDAGQAIDLKI